MNTVPHNPLEKPSHALLLAAQAAIGCGAGLAIAQKLKPNARNIASVASFALGVALAVPLIVNLFSKRINSPETKRGSRRRLRSIREDIGFPSEVDFY